MKIFLLILEIEIKEEGLESKEDKANN